MSESVDGAVLDVEVGIDTASDAVDVATDVSEEQEHSTEEKDTQDDKDEGKEQGKKSDPLQRRLAELKKQAETLTDPKAKAQAQADYKQLRDSVGKLRAYESQFGTVREVRELKSLIDAVGGSEGFQKLQDTVAEVQDVDARLAAGDPSVIEDIWKEAPEGMVKLAPAIFDRFAKENPEAYATAMAPHFVGFLDTAQFPEAFDTMTQLIADGKTKEALQIAARMAQWVGALRGQGKGQGADTKSQREQELERQLQDRQKADGDREANAAYGEVEQHAGPTIDKHLKAMVASMNLSKEQYTLLRQDTWKLIQEQRNADQTYKTVAPAKYKQGIKSAVEYIKQQTEDRAKEAARHTVKLRYGHLLKKGASPAAKVNPTQPNKGTVKGELPSRDQIDYGQKGLATARKEGYKSIEDMLLDGKAPLKTGEIRKWR